MKRDIVWVLLWLLLSSIASAEELNKPFAVSYDIYDFDITMDSFIIKPHSTMTEL